MIIERQLEDAFITTLSAMSELSCAQIVGSRTVAPQGETKEEEDTAKTIVAVACGFRQNDAFSLSPITMPLSISILTRVELDTTSEEHDRIVEAIADLLSRWHKFGDEMSEALTTDKFFAGELRMDGGTARIFDPTKATWSETISFSIRGSEKFVEPVPPEPPIPPEPELSNCYAVYADGHTSEWHVFGDTFNSINIDKTGLVSLRIQTSNITKIGINALAGASQLSSIEIPNTVVTIDRNAFEDCTSLSSIVLPESLQRINKQCFQGSTNIRTLNIPESVGYIGEDAFYLCTSVDDIYCYPNPNNLTWEDGECDDFKADGSTRCHVKSQYLSEYQSFFTGVVNVTFVGDLS